MCWVRAGRVLTRDRRSGLPPPADASVPTVPRVARGASAEVKVVRFDWLSLIMAPEAHARVQVRVVLRCSRPLAFLYA